MGEQNINLQVCLFVCLFVRGRGKIHRDTSKLCLYHLRCGKRSGSQN